MNATTPITADRPATAGEGREHTPGPWFTGEMSHRVFHDEGHGSVAYAEVENDPNGYVRACANARLIAAAPELLAALRGLLPVTSTARRNPADPAHHDAEVAQWEYERDQGNGEAPAILAAYAAIAKATGK